MAWQKVSNDAAVRQALVIFVVARLFLSLWAIIAIAINPVPAEPDEVLRPYLGEPQLVEGAPGLLLGPWQRFDTQHYLRIAGQGYVHEEDSVFPPLYPLAVRVLGRLLGGMAVSNLLAGILLSNLACLGLLILLHRVTTAEIDPGTATRTLIYLVFFPTGFFLFAAYTEPIFMLFALGSLWAGRNGRFWPAGVLGLLAALTRLTGWVLVVPLAYEVVRRRVGSGKWGVESGERRGNERFSFLAPLLPVVGVMGFLGWRWWVGLPALTVIYEQYWYQTTGFPGSDVITAANTLFFGGPVRTNEIIALSFDFACMVLLFVTTALAFRRLGTTYGLYSAMLLLFMLLPTSEFKPLYSFSRYTLAFLPTFMLLGLTGQRPWLNRLILYPSLALYLFFSGQFFVWGWVA